MRRVLRIAGAVVVASALGAAALSSARATPAQVESVCVNRISAEVRVPDGSCTRYEARLDIPRIAPVTFAVHQTTGQVYYFTDGNAPRWMAPLEVLGDGSVTFGVHRITGDLYYGVSSRYLKPVVI